MEVDAKSGFPHTASAWCDLANDLQLKIARINGEGQQITFRNPPQRIRK
jgi:hypothetical protein